jgi:hypothetical protein
MMNKNNNHFTTLAIILTLVVLVLSSGCEKSTGTAIEPATQPDLPAATEPMPTEGAVVISTVLFQDDFQDGDNTDWTIKSGWAIQQNEDKFFLAAGGAGGAYVPTGAGWEDYSLHASAWVREGVLLFSINLSSEARYVLRMGGDGVYLIKEQPAETFTVMAEAGPITLSKWTRVAFASQQGHLQVYIDKVLWFDVVDPEPILEGTIAVSAQQGSRVAVDNILVKRINGELAAGIPRAPAPPSSETLDTQELQAVGETLSSEDVETTTADVPADQPDEPNGVPDLVISPLMTIPDPVQKGVGFVVVISVTNIGNASSGAFDVLVHFHALANIEDCSMAVPDLAPGQIVEGACGRTITSNAGNYPVELTADISATVTESDEANNLVVDTLTVAAPAAPTDTPESGAGLLDVGASSISFVDELNGISRYRCLFTTSGQGLVPFILIQLSIDGTVFHEATYPSIPAGSPSHYIFSVDTIPPFSLTCTLDADNSIAESDETNNSITVNFP